MLNQNLGVPRSVLDPAQARGGEKMSSLLNCEGNVEQWVFKSGCPLKQSQGISKQNNAFPKPGILIIGRSEKLSIGVLKSDI